MIPDLSVENIITWAIIGGVAGSLARQVVKGFRTGLLGTVFVGVVGAVIGGWLVQQPGVTINLGNELLTTVATAFVGSVVLLLLLRLVHN